MENTLGTILIVATSGIASAMKAPTCPYRNPETTKIDISFQFDQDGPRKCLVGYYCCGKTNQECCYNYVLYGPLVAGIVAFTVLIIVLISCYKYWWGKIRKRTDARIEEAVAETEYIAYQESRF